MNNDRDNAIKVGIVGDTGRLGSHICKEMEDLGWSVVIRLSSKVTRIEGKPDVLLECARPELTAETVALALRYRCPVIFATSGRGSEHEALLLKASLQVPVVVARNLTRGSAMQRRLAGTLASRVADEERVVIDRHPATKLDAPSATAKALAASAAAERIEVLRFGAPVAEHSVVLNWPGESLEIVHRVSSLRGAALGALELIRRLQSQSEAGLYEFLYPELIKIR